MLLIGRVLENGETPGRHACVRASNAALTTDAYMGFLYTWEATEGATPLIGHKLE